MKQTPLLPTLAAALFVALWTPASAQVDADSMDTPAPPGSTVITSDELHSDQVAHTSIFDGKVLVVGTNFRMTCQEMTVFFTNDNKVQKIVATGDVVINQPDRVTHCGHAEYYKDNDTFVLTDSPIIHDHDNEVHGVRITIDRQTQKMTVDGGRSKVIIGNQSLGAPTTTNAPSGTPPAGAPAPTGQ
jgi:lipopolysaccharide transport protein LptA